MRIFFLVSLWTSFICHSQGVPTYNQCLRLEDRICCNNATGQGTTFSLVCLWKIPTLPFSFDNDNSYFLCGYCVCWHWTIWYIISGFLGLLMWPQTERFWLLSRNTKLKILKLKTLFGTFGQALWNNKNHTKDFTVVN